MLLCRLTVYSFHKFSAHNSSRKQMAETARSASSDKTAREVVCVFVHTMSRFPRTACLLLRQPVNTTVRRMPDPAAKNTHSREKTYHHTQTIGFSWSDWKYVYSHKCVFWEFLVLKVAFEFSGGTHRTTTTSVIVLSKQLCCYTSKISVFCWEFHDVYITCCPSIKVVN